MERNRQFKISTDSTVQFTYGRFSFHPRFSFSFLFLIPVDTPRSLSYRPICTAQQSGDEVVQQEAKFSATHLIYLCLT